MLVSYFLKGTWQTAHLLSIIRAKFVYPLFWNFRCVSVCECVSSFCTAKCRTFYLFFLWEKLFDNSQKFLKNNHLTVESNIGWEGDGDCVLEMIWCSKMRSSVTNACIYILTYIRLFHRNAARKIGGYIIHLFIFLFFSFLNTLFYQMNQVLDAMFERKVSAGEIVIRQGDDGDNFYVIES